MATPITTSSVTDPHQSYAEIGLYSADALFATLRFNRSLAIVEAAQKIEWDPIDPLIPSTTRYMQARRVARALHLLGRHEEELALARQQLVSGPIQTIGSSTRPEELRAHGFAEAAQALADRAVADTEELASESSNCERCRAEALEEARRFDQAGASVDRDDGCGIARDGQAVAGLKEAAVFELAAHGQDGLLTRGDPAGDGRLDDGRTRQPCRQVVTVVAVGVLDLARGPEEGDRARELLPADRDQCERRAVDVGDIELARQLQNHPQRLRIEPRVGYTRADLGRCLDGCEVGQVDRELFVERRGPVTPYISPNQVRDVLGLEGVDDRPEGVGKFVGDRLGRYVSFSWITVSSCSTSGSRSFLMIAHRISRSTASYP